MNFFRFKKYTFIPSYEIKTSSKIEYLLLTYEKLFLKYRTEKGFYTKEDKEILYKGIQEVSKYIINGLFYQITETYNSKTSLDKKMNALLNIAKYQHYSTEAFYEYLEEELMIISENIIFDIIGITENNKNNIFIKTTENANIIFFMKNKLYFEFLEFLEKKVNSFNNLSINLLEDTYEIKDEEKEELVNILLKESLLEKAVSKEIKEKIKYALLNDDIDKEIKPYIEFLANFKEKNYDTNNN